jgi:hypothetical protein
MRKRDRETLARAFAAGTLTPRQRGRLQAYLDGLSAADESDAPASLESADIERDIAPEPEPTDRPPRVLSPREMDEQERMQLANIVNASRAAADAALEGRALARCMATSSLLNPPVRPDESHLPSYLRRFI